MNYLLDPFNLVRSIILNDFIKTMATTKIKFQTSEPIFIGEVMVKSAEEVELLIKVLPLDIFVIDFD